MLWLPAQSRDDCAASIGALLELRPAHVSFYLLELYPNAPLREEMARADWSLAPDDGCRGHVSRHPWRRTDAAGYEQYEISNVARPGSVAAITSSTGRMAPGSDSAAARTRRGPGAAGNNVADTRRYVDMVEHGQPPAAERAELTPAEQLGDALFTGLRMADG